MPRIHGKNTVVLVAGNDLSQYANNSQVEITADSHDISGYGLNAHAFQGGLLNGTSSVSGIYDSSQSTGPRAVLRPLVGTTVAVIIRPEGTGAGKPQDSGQCVVTKYTQTQPVADMITWAVDLQLTGDVAYAVQ